MTGRHAARTRLNACLAHQIDAERNNWCDECDTGECPDCGLPTFFDNTIGWYRHITHPERGCFLIKGEDAYLRRADGSIYGIGEGIG